MIILFAERLNELMKEKNINQRELEKLTGITNQAISRWLNGQVLPTVPYLWKLADYFKVSIDYLIGREKF